MGMDPEWASSFKEKLDEYYAWPDVYIFKFIVPKGKEEQVKELFPKHESIQKPSKNGNYTSITVQAMMPSTDAVVDIYVRAASIEGLVAL